MYEWFEVSNFRCFKHLHIEGLKRVNLIGGRNNVGKTALLEALCLHAGSRDGLAILADPDALRFDGSAGRSLTPEGPGWSDLAWMRNASLAIELEGGQRLSEAETSDNLRIDRSSRALRIVLRGTGDLHRHAVPWQDSLPAESQQAFRSAHHALAIAWEQTHEGAYTVVVPEGRRGRFAGPPLTRFRDAALMRSAAAWNGLEADLFAPFQREGREDELVEALRVLEPRAAGLVVVSVDATPMLQVRVEGAGLMPLHLLGEGFRRYTQMLLRLADIPGGVLLIDEIENGLHYSAHEQVWRALGEAARRFDVQIIATTHSRECVMAAHRAFQGEMEDDFRYFRLEQRGEETVALRYDAEQLGAAEEMNLEVR